MNTNLLDNVYNRLLTSLSGSTTNIYFDHLPDQKLLAVVNVVYNLSNTSNENTFDAKEANKFYSLDVKINAPQLSKLQTNSIYQLKGSLYNLPVSYIKSIDEDLFYDPDLNVWTNFYRFEIQAD